MSQPAGGVREHDRATRAVVTRTALEQTFRRLGVQEGGVLVVHAALSTLGYVVHGVPAVLAALRSVLGPEGTLMVPTFTGEHTDPSCWVDPPLPAAMWDEVRDSMPAFDERRTLPNLMGLLPLAVLADPDRKRSTHPLVSWAALGPRAEELVARHDLRDPFGQATPLGAARRLGAQVLLLGVDQRCNAAILHAQAVVDAPQVRRNKGAFLAVEDGRRDWIVPTHFGECTAGFQKIEDELVVRGLVRVCLAGDATCRLMSMEPFSSSLEHLLRHRPEAISCDHAACRQCRGG